LITKLPFLSFEKIENNIKEEVLLSFETFFLSRRYILGKQLHEFEKNLFLALKALNIGQGDEVIIPSNTFIASALAITHCGATPIFVEPNNATYNLNPENIVAAITAKTKAIMPVHLYGQACEMDAIMAIAKQQQLYVIEDNAQAQYAQKIRALRNYGSSKKYYNEIIGYNKRLDECQAVFLNIKLKYLAQWNQERQQIATWYATYLQSISEVTLPQIAKGATSVYHLFVIRIFERNKLKAFLETQGVQTLIHYPIPPHLQACYQFLGYKKGDFPIAEEISDTCLSLPIYPGLKETDVKYITSKIKTFYGR